MCAAPFDVFFAFLSREVGLAALSSFVFTSAWRELCFNYNSKTFKAQFSNLHEGHRPFKTKLLRVYRANGHMDDKGGSIVLLNISRINHSCKPNALVDDTGHTTSVLALRTISKDEEVLVEYRDLLQSLTTGQRQQYLQAYWGFQCSCTLCSMPANLRSLSDTRRQLIYYFDCLTWQGYALDPNMVSDLVLELERQVPSICPLKGQ